MKRHEYKLRVRYSEIDGMNQVHNSSYLIYFEEARTDLVRAAGYPYSEIEADGFFFPLSEARIRYLKPIVYDEPLTVQVTVGYLKNFSAKFNYRILDGEGTEVCTGSTTHAALSTETMDFAEVPARIRQILEPHVEL